MTPELRRDLMAALERPHRLGTIGGDLEEQLVHCASCSSVLQEIVDASADLAPPRRGIDLGTGGGVPGVVLAALWPSMHWTLVDMRSARVDEVERTILRLHLDERVDVIATEAQRLGHLEEHREGYDIAVARAFGPPSITAECAAGVVRVGGVFLVAEPPEDVPDRWDLAALTSLGFSLPHVYESNGARFAALTKRSSAPDSVPRLPPRSNRGWYR